MNISKKSKTKHKTCICQICKKSFFKRFLVPGVLVRDVIQEEIRKKHPEWDPSAYICVADLDVLRTIHMENILKEGGGKLSQLEQEVIQSYKDHDLVTEDINNQIAAKLTFGEKLADSVARFGGSWLFIITFGVVILSWIFVNAYFASKRPFDPYPFILLNLVLSCLAAIQAPVIMMSQNRQSKKDRIKADYEYTINLKAELEVQHINSKLDQLMREQWNGIMEVQQIQIDLMKEIKKNIYK